MPWFDFPRATCIFLVATELVYKSNAAERHSLEYLKTFRGMFGDILRNIEDIPQNVLRHPSKCFTTFPRKFGDISRNVLRHPLEYFATFAECLATFPRMLEDIPRNDTIKYQ